MCPFRCTQNSQYEELAIDPERWWPELGCNVAGDPAAGGAGPLVLLLGLAVLTRRRLTRRRLARLLPSIRGSVGALPIVQALGAPVAHAAPDPGPLTGLMLGSRSSISVDQPGASAGLALG